MEGSGPPRFLTDAALSVCAAAKRRSSGSGGCRSGRAPRNSWLLERARAELEPRIRYQQDPGTGGGVVQDTGTPENGSSENIRCRFCP